MHAPPKWARIGLAFVPAVSFRIVLIAGHLSPLSRFGFELRPLIQTMRRSQLSLSRHALGLWRGCCRGWNRLAGIGSGGIAGRCGFVGRHFGARRENQNLDSSPVLVRIGVRLLAHAKRFELTVIKTKVLYEVFAYHHGTGLGEG